MDKLRLLHVLLYLSVVVSLYMAITGGWNFGIFIVLLALTILVKLARFLTGD